jgi:hypothetical protein
LQNDLISVERFRQYRLKQQASQEKCKHLDTVRVVIV